ncbi:hypothetical protein ATEIFO6365_0008011700 [Aspergillus terreus]|uniref:Uncharacterized protein n=1 Tax=Aspergillus terreus TaxID=33178 RepID=A0A5M3Z5V5_ASPTE|nr:hypothetical protein ATETN484_0010012600 [Aspergillus terreus]GFF18176.1 hypothetical protein ATEIFO6365_0008011700 [Aspergillus terreus]
MLTRGEKHCRYIETAAADTQAQVFNEIGSGALLQEDQRPRLSRGQKRRRQIENAAAEARTLVLDELRAAGYAVPEEEELGDLRMELDRRRPELRQIKEHKKELQARLEETNALLGARLREGSYRSASPRRLVHRAPAAGRLLKEGIERIRNEAREQHVYKELNLEIELDEPGPAAAEPAQGLTTGQRLYWDETNALLEARVREFQAVARKLRSLIPMARLANFQML